MREEVHVACEFLSRMLETKNLPVQFVNQFKKRLEELLVSRFENHWDTANPSKGSAYRCIRINGRLDPVIRDAAKVTGLSNISTYLPAEFTMWIDPKEVSYRFGEEGSICNCSLDSIRAENVAAPPAEWHRQLSSSPPTIHQYQIATNRSSYPQSPVSRSRTSPVPRRSSPNGKYSPTPTSTTKRSLSPPLYYGAAAESSVNHHLHHHHHYNSTQANSSATGYHQFPYSNYVIPVHV